MHLKQNLFTFLLYQCYLLQSFPIIFIQIIHDRIKEMKINNKTLTYKINCTRLTCKVQFEHTEYTTTLIDEKHVKRKTYFSKSLREEEKKNNKKKRQAPHNLAYVIALHLLHCGHCVYLNQMCVRKSWNCNKFH